MKKKTGKPIFQVARIAATEENESRQFLRFCSKCFEEDIQQYGEAYWHRMHQIPGASVCLTHGITLDKSFIPLQEGHLGGYTVKLKDGPIDADETVFTEDTLQQLLVLSREISWLIGSKFDFKGLQWLRSQYQRQLAAQGFVDILPSKTFKFNDQKFVNAVFDFYGEEYWDFVKPGLHKQAAPYFAHCLFACDIAPVIDRVTHISLIRFLSSSLKEFFKE